MRSNSVRKKVNSEGQSRSFHFRTPAGRARRTAQVPQSVGKQEHTKLQVQFGEFRAPAGSTSLLWGPTAYFGAPVAPVNVTSGPHHPVHSIRSMFIHLQSRSSGGAAVERFATRCEPLETFHDCSPKQQAGCTDTRQTRIGATIDARGSTLT